jgi:polysaccharide deacetylase family protein (PEP-CTERM system associated)
MGSQVVQPSHFFTVDVEEYFQVRALRSVVSRDGWLSRPSRVAKNIDDLLSCLDRHRTRGTFFVLGWIARYHPEVVRTIAQAGHEIASHGFWHDQVTSMTPAEFLDDVRSSRRELEDVSGTQIVGYRAPSFSIIPGWEWALDVLIDAGYRYDSSLFPIRRRGYGYPSAQRTPHVIQRPKGKLAEFPLATTRILSYAVPAAGGGYLRQLPLAVIRRAFREASKRGESATFYIHPWEIDPDQPRLAVSQLNRIRHYRGLDGALERIERLLEEFTFDSIASSLAGVEAQAATQLTKGAA